MWLLMLWDCFREICHCLCRRSGHLQHELYTPLLLQQHKHRLFEAGCVSGMPELKDSCVCLLGSSASCTRLAAEINSELSEY